MAKSHYLPNADQERALWLQNFAIKFSNYATIFGFVAADATAVNNDSTAFSYILGASETFKSEAQERVSYKDILANGPLGSPLGAFPGLPTLPAAPTVVASGVFPRIGAIIKRIKAHPAYTEAIGKDLGIIGADPVLKTSVAKPLITLTTKGGVVVVKYKKGRNTGIQLLSMRGTETEFTQLAVVTQTKYSDNRPNLVKGQPELRKYCAWYIQKDVPIGQCSDEVSILL